MNVKGVIQANNEVINLHNSCSTVDLAYPVSMVNKYMARLDQSIKWGKRGLCDS